MSNMQDIAIIVTETGTAAARTLACQILLDGNVVSERTLFPVQSRQVAEMAGQYFSLLKNSGGTKAAKSYLPVLSDGLHHLFLEAGEKDWMEGIVPGARLTIVCTIPEVLQLPWELLPLWGKAQKLPGDFYVVRCPLAFYGPQAFRQKPSPGPLRVLFLASDLHDCENEALSIQQAAEGLDLDLVVCESGSIDELKSLAESFRPHLLHLVGGVIMSGGNAVISLPGSSGRADPRTAEDIAVALQGLGLAGIILSGRQSDMPHALHQLSQRLCEKVAPTVAWYTPAALVRQLYQHLAAGKSLEESVHALSQAILQSSSSDKNSVSLSIPALYSVYSNFAIFSPQDSIAASGALPCQKPLVFKGLREGWVDCFIDRREETARLLSALLDGSIHALVLTGPEGVGKSTLASHLAGLLTPAGYSVLPVYGSRYNPITGVRLLEKVAVHLVETGREARAAALKDAHLEVSKRLLRLSDVLKSHRILLLLDGLELNGRTGKIDDPDLARFYLQMLRGMGTGRAIITCKTLPADAMTLPARAWQWKLQGLGQAAFVRALLRERTVADRYKKGETSYARLAEHHSSSAGFPARLAQTAKALSLSDLSAGEDALAALTARLDPLFLRALARMAVYNIAISPAGLVAVSGLDQEQAAAAARHWQGLSLAVMAGDLITVPSALCVSLLAAMSPDDLRLAEKAAGGFLREQAEGGRSAELGLSRLDVLMEALGHYLAGEDWDAARVVTARISGYLRRRGYHSELIRLNQELLNLLPQSSPSITAGPLAWIAQAHLDLGEFRKAAGWYERALQAAPDAASHYGLGLALMNQGDLDGASGSLNRALEAFHAVGDLSGEAASLGSLAGIDLKKEERAAASKKMERVIEIMKSRKDLPGEAAALQEAARLDMMGGNFDAARSRLSRSLQLLEGAGEGRGRALALFNLASLDLERGSFQIAGEEFSRSLPLFREMGDRAGTAAILHSLGMIQSQAGEKEKAAHSFKEALAINQDLGDRGAEAGAFFQLGALAVLQDKKAEGLHLMALAAVVLRSIKSDELKNVEPLVERLASQLKYSQEQFMAMVQEVFKSYSRDRGWGLVERAWGK
jgi:tetratricopeptide (TPR) repeat protein/energy-coupling factor transporter ATP-binding protein EcfA2